MISKSLNRFSEVYEYLFDGRKDIELFGMYGAANIGDEAMKIVGLATLPAGRTVATPLPTRLPVIRDMLATKTRPNLVFGGGTLIHGGADDGSNDWLSVAQRFARAGARLAFFGTGISFYEEQLANPNPSAKGWAAALAQASHVGLRGPLSQRQAAQLGVEAEIFGDAAFALHREGRAGAARDKTRIGLNFGECLGDQATYEAINAGLLRELAKQFHCVLYVVRPSDRASTQRIIAQSGVGADRYSVEEIFEDVLHYIDSVAQCHAFIGLKLHAAGLALVSGVPSLLFQYEKKCRDFMLPIELEQCLIDMASDAETVERQVEALLAEPEQFRNDRTIGAMAAHQRRTIDSYFGSASATSRM